VREESFVELSLLGPLVLYRSLKMELVDRLTKEAPNLRHALSLSVLKSAFLDGPDAPFASDEAYMKFVCSELALKEHLKADRELLRQLSTQPKSKVFPFLHAGLIRTGFVCGCNMFCSPLILRLLRR